MYIHPSKLNNLLNSSVSCHRTLHHPLDTLSCLMSVFIKKGCWPLHDITCPGWHQNTMQSNAGRVCLGWHKVIDWKKWSMGGQHGEQPENTDCQYLPSSHHTYFLKHTLHPGPLYTTPQDTLHHYIHLTLLYTPGYPYTPWTTYIHPLQDYYIYIYIVIL